MKTDRELLELAAKAAGIRVERSRYGLVLQQSLCKERRMGSVWNPLTDDGDALRLAVKLGIADLVNFYDDDADDPYAATRRAIVRAAAEIGKSL